MKKARALIGMVVLALALSSAVAATFEATAVLEPTQTGYDLGAEGKARISRSDQDRQVQRFVVKLSAKLEDGTVVMVSATTEDGDTFDVGAMRMLLGSAALELNSFEDDLSRVFPVEAVKSVSVSLQGRILVEGKFVTDGGRETLYRSGTGFRTTLQGR